MRKIASPQDLTAELQRLLAYAGGRQPSRQKLAWAFRQLAAAVSPVKVASLTDDDTLYQLVEMEMESSGYEGDIDSEHMREVEAKASRYEDAVEKTLLAWVKNNMGKLRVGERGLLQRADDPQDVVNVMLSLRGGAAYLYFMEAEGHGVGTWDGDWDQLFHDHRSSLKELSRVVESRTSSQFRDLKTAMEEAAWEAGGSPD